jgi:hypothetical protein
MVVGFTTTCAIKSPVVIGKHVIVTWMLSHIGIHGNTDVDQEAKNTLNDIKDE